MKKTGKYFLTIVCIISCVMIAVTLMLMAIGIHPFVLKSESMEPTYKKGSLCFINTNLKVNDLVIGDVIAYKEYNGIYVLHRIVDEGFIIKGDANEVGKEVALTEESFIGKEVFTIPKVGQWIDDFPRWGRTALGIVLLIIAVRGCFLAYKGIKLIHNNG